MDVQSQDWPRDFWVSQKETGDEAGREAFDTGSRKKKKTDRYYGQVTRWPSSAPSSYGHHFLAR